MNKELHLPLEIVGKITFLVEIGIIENLTIDRSSYEINNCRVFKFDPEIWPAVVLMLERMYKIDVNKFLNETL